MESNLKVADTKGFNAGFSAIFLLNRLILERKIPEPWIDTLWTVDLACNWKGSVDPCGCHVLCVDQINKCTASNMGKGRENFLMY